MAEKKAARGMTIKVPQEFALAIRNAAKVSGVSERKIRELLATRLFSEYTAAIIPKMVHDMVGTQLGLDLDDE